MTTPVHHHPAHRSARPAGEEGLERATTVRWGLIRRVKAELARGTYLTTERWEGAVERLIARESLAR